MARQGLFDDLPPPHASLSPPPPPSSPSPHDSPAPILHPKPASPPPPKPALKRLAQESDHNDEGGKRVRFKTIVDTGSQQITDAMRKIASHIGNSTKFSKASKLALQLVQSGSLTKDTSDLFFEILKASMASPALANEPALRQGYRELFSAVNEHLECFDPAHVSQLRVWILRAELANDFFTDDTFVFSKAANKVKQEISLLPEATACEDASVVLEHETCSLEKPKESLPGAVSSNENVEESELESDPFGLNEFLSKPSKKEGKMNRKKDEETASRAAQKHEEQMLRERREALMACLEIAAGRYKIKWAQTIIDILVKNAFDSLSKFTASQRDAIEKLWNSVREQQIRRKQGKSATGKLDVTAFERLQNQYSQAKISIRHSVGADGDRSAEQWLG